MIAHQKDWDTSAQRGKSSRSITSSSLKIATLTQQISEMNKNFLRMSQSNQQVNVDNPSCETCVDPHHYSVWDQTALSVNLFEISYCYCLLLQSCARDSNYCSYYCPLPPKVRRLLSLTTGLCGLVLIRSDSDSPDKDDFTKHISTPTSYITPPFIYANAILRAPSFFWIEPRIAGPPMLLQLLLRAGEHHDVSSRACRRWCALLIYLDISTDFILSSSENLSQGGPAFISTSGWAIS
ncbi:hypothetical protein Tco_0018157 [Tanacetum coccineum]